MYAVGSRQDAGAQWRSKAGGRENAGTVVPRVSPTVRQGQAMEDVRIRYSTGLREGAGVVQRMAEEEQERTEQGGQQGERPGKPRAVLGRRVEPYSEDIEGFIEICKKNNSEKDKVQKVQKVQKYVKKLIRKKPKQKAGDKDDYESIPIPGEYVCDKRVDNSIYPKSVNVYIKNKILKKEETAEEYRRRVLDVKYWNIDKNREWLNTGRVVEYESNDANGAASVGIENGGQFRLVGLEEVEKDIFTMVDSNKEFAYKENKGNVKRRIKFRSLQKAPYSDVKHPEDYEAAFQNKSGIPTSNFIAYVVMRLQTKDLLYNNKSSKTKQGFPTVLAQEMEQLDEEEYRFAKISEGRTVKKVIAMPETAAKDFQTEGTQTAPQPTPSGTP